MTPATIRPRLPGVRFQVELPPPAEVLPRMDIAAFAGLAMAGPIGVPVPVEDVPTFRDWFGTDVELAVDPETGRTVYSQLGPAIEAFFRNGGRRCWVLRLAGSDTNRGFPATNRFLVPGLVSPNSGAPMWLTARCPGSWCDDFRVGAVETRIRLRGALRPSSTRLEAVLERSSPAVMEGDVLRVVFAEATALIRVQSCQLQEDGSQLVEAGEALWLRAQAKLDPAGVSAKLLVPDPSGLAAVACLVGEGGESLVIEAATLADALPHLAPGMVLRAELASSPPATILVLLNRVESRLAEDQSPPLAVVELGFETVFQELEAADATAAAAGVVLRLERLQFGLRVWRGEEFAGSLDRLEFSPERDRFWGRLPDDRKLFRMEKGRLPEVVSGTLPFEARGPSRFPLAAGGEAGGGVFFPVGLPEAADSQRTSPAWVPAGSPLQRDGLATFEAIRFLDPTLDSLGVGTVLLEANHRRFVRNLDLEGFYALLPCEEVTLIGVPDAVHRAWKDAEPKARIVLAAPEIRRVGERVAWDPVPFADSYDVEQAWDTEFGVHVSRVVRELAWVEIVPPSGCLGETFCRVRARRTGVRSGPWSATLGLLHGGTGFRECAAPPRPAAPRAKWEASVQDGHPQGRLVWQGVGNATAYEVQHGADEAFVSVTATDRFPGTVTAAGPYRVREPMWFRVRALGASAGEAGIGPWSNVVGAEPPPVAGGRELVALETYAGTGLPRLLSVHEALARFCAARGDLLALLSLPAHFRATEAVDYQQELRRRLVDEAESYAALYHPWLTTLSEDPDIGEARTQPPEGAVAGVFARRARARGAWVAPANEGLRAVAGLEPELSLAAWEELFAVQVNLVREDPRGFMPLSAFTLSEDPDLRQINVRRLLILLRRVVWREGNRLVFEPNSTALRARLQTQFTRLLEDLFTRGAFAGRTPAEAFRVAVDDSLNPAESVELGRLIVEIQVAPSRPLQFLTVRLVQAGLESLAVDSA